jgi:hypothetical protein
MYVEHVEVTVEVLVNVRMCTKYGTQIVILDDGPSMILQTVEGPFLL